jgi:diacylglycerol kinase family enzyme
MGILPGGTGNGFAREMGIPKLAEAVELLCTSRKLRPIDVATVNDQYFIQRMYVGIEPEEQTSREMKDKYGVMAYAVNIAKRSRNSTTVHYRAVVDGEAMEFDAAKAYVVNSGMMGTGLSITHKYAIDDGYLDAYFLDRGNMDTLYAAGDRFLNLSTSMADKYYRQFKELTLETDPDQPVWSDGEYVCRTPVTVRVVPGALPIVVG